MSTIALDLHNAVEEPASAPKVEYRKLNTGLDQFADRLGAVMKASVIGDYFNPCRLAVISKSGSAILTCTETGAEPDKPGQSDFISVRIEFVRNKAGEALGFLDRFDKAFCAELSI